MDKKEITSFLFEIGTLRRIQREGWKLIGVKTPETVAEHSLRAAQIGYILAKLEGYPHPEIVSTILIFHDIGECRIGDLHKVANRYIQKDEKKTLEEQLKPLSDIGEDIFDLWEQFEYKTSRAGIIARDADLLELAATACEYLNQGFGEAEDWIKNTEKRLITESAKKLLAEMRETNPYRWWRGLKKLE